MMLKRGNLKLEVFPHPEWDPKSGWFGCCFRLGDLDAFYACCKVTGQPHIHAPCAEAWGGQMGALIAYDRSLIRLIYN